MSAKLERSLGNVRDLITTCVGSSENRDITSFGEINFNSAANNFQDANLNEIADLHTIERVVIPEEQVNTPNEGTRALMDEAALVLAQANLLTAKSTRGSKKSLQTMIWII